MKRINFLIPFIFLIASCEESSLEEAFSPKSRFDNPFPKRSINLETVFGDQLFLLAEGDTLELSIAFEKENRVNVISDVKGGELIFKGTASRYRGMLYLNEQISDSTYWIYAVKIENDSVKGLQTGWFQMLMWDKLIESRGDSLFPNNGKNRLNLESIAKHEDDYLLTPEKKILRTFYESIIDSFPAFKILFKADSTNTDSNNTKKSNILEEKEIHIEKIYPNPAHDFIHIDMKHQCELNYKLQSIKGDFFTTGELNLQDNTIDISRIENGLYSITFTNEKKSLKQTFKFIKE